jgi:hypothetical protein
MLVTKKTEDAGELPEDIARLVAANSTTTFLSSREGLLLLFSCLPWVCRAQPEELYWPAEQLEVIRQKWNPEQAARLLRETQAANPAPSRSGPACAGPQRAMSVCLGQEVQAVPWPLTVPRHGTRRDHDTNGPSGELHEP